jgi:hypothetical protein
LRFAVHRPGIPDASPRIHGVPRRDVPRRIHVSVERETADRTYEARLALARLRIYMSARRAALARIVRIDFLYPARSLLFQATHQQAPPRPQDLAVQPSFLADVPAWGISGASRGASHVADPQVLNADHVEAPRDIRALFLRPILAPIRLASEQPGDSKPYLLAAVGSPFSTGELPLQAHYALTLPNGQSRRTLAGLLQVTRCALPARAPMRVLFDRKVPHVPGVRNAPAALPLGWSREAGGNGTYEHTSDSHRHFSLRR